MRRSILFHENRIGTDSLLLRFVVLLAALALALALATTAAAGTMYVSLVGDFPTAGGQHNLLFSLTRSVGSAEVLRFQTFASGGGTNAAGDTIIPPGIDSIVQLFDSLNASRGINDDFDTINHSTDSLLSWPGFTPNPAGANTPLNPNPLPTGSYRLNLSEFGNDSPGHWALDLVGPDDAMVFTGTSATGTSTISTLKAGNGAQVNFMGGFELDGGKSFTFQSGADFTVTGYLDIGNTTSGSLTVKNPGSTLTTNTASTTYLDWGLGGGTASVTLSDQATANILASYINIAADASSIGLLTIESGADMITNGLYLASAGGLGQVEVRGTGSTLTQNSGSTLTIGSNSGLAGLLYVHDNAVFTSGTGVIEVNPTGQIRVNDATFNANGNLTVASTSAGLGGVILENQGQINSHDVFVGSNSSTGSVLVNGFVPGIGARATWNVTGSMTIGSAGFGSGSATVEQAGRLDISNNLTVAGSVDATGTLTVQTNGQVDIGNQLTIGNHGTVNLLGSEITARSFVVQPFGTFTHTDGTLTIDGGTFDPGTGTADYVITGATSTDRPKVVLTSGAQAALAGMVVVGQNNWGELSLENGAVLSATNVQIGDTTTALAGGKVTVQGSSSRLIVTGPPLIFHSLNVGQEGPGELRVSGGGQVNVPQGGVSLGCCFWAGAGSGEIVVEGQDSRLEARYVQFRAVGGNSRVTIRDRGLVHATDPNGYNEIWPASTGVATDIDVEVTDSGSLLKVDGSLLRIYGQNSASGSTARLTIHNGGTAQVAGDVSLYGVILGSAFIDVDGGAAGTATLDVDRTLYVGGDDTQAVEGTAKVTVANGGQVTASSMKVWHPGTIELYNGGVNTGSLELAGGTLRGNGDVSLLSAQLTNAGVVAPGLSAGVLNINGDYVQDTAGRLAIQIGGAAFHQFDRLQVNGSATLGGWLDVSLIAPPGSTSVFEPIAGQSFEILTAASGLGGTEFLGTDFPPLPSSDLRWHALYGPNTVTLAVGILGDYNLNGVVDAADYVVWRETYRGPNVPPPSLAADGDVDGDVDNNDWNVWRAHFGQTVASGAGAIFAHGDAPAADHIIPEPASGLLLIVAAASLARAWRRSSRLGV